MARYIDAELFLRIETKRCGCVPLVGSCTTDNESLAYQLAKAPTADVVEVKHGKWIIKTDEYDCEYMMCSVCKEEFYPVDADTVDTTPNYCPNCGAKMDLKEGAQE